MFFARRNKTNLCSRKRAKYVPYTQACFVRKSKTNEKSMDYQNLYSESESYYVDIGTCFSAPLCLRRSTTTGMLILDSPSPEGSYVQ